MNEKLSQLFAVIVTLLFTGSLQAQLTREANTSLNLPADLPSGAFSVPEAFPGLFFTRPVAIVTPPGETNRIFVVEQRGVISVIPDLANPAIETFLDWETETRDNNNEEGMLGLVFHPNYNNVGQPGYGDFFVYYQITVSGGGGRHWRLSRFSVSAENLNAADPLSEVPMITQPDQQWNHNGGDLQFGDDGYLYVAVGDEGGFNDQYDNGQRIDKDFYSAIFRLDVDLKPESLDPNPHSSIHAGTYKVPADNPFIGATTFNGLAINQAALRTEIWATGLRNPWRINFDRPTGRLFVADVGQNAHEEVNIMSPAVFATNAGVPNYGWSYREGFSDFNNGPGGATPPAGFTHIEPIHDYPHSQGQSVTGGLVYRGANYPELTGDYIFADYVSGRIWSMDDPGGATQSVTEIANEGGISSFGLDPSTGDILLADLNNHRIRRLTRTEVGGAQPPQFLSATGAFSNLANLTPNTGIVPYDVNVPFWSDNAEKSRWFSIPNVADDMEWAADDAWNSPEGQVWIKHFDLDLNRDAPGTNVRRLETRFLVKTADDVYGLTYRWNAGQTDAELVEAEGAEEIFTITEDGSTRDQTWTYPSRNDCRTCHNPTAGYSLSFNTRQLNLDFQHGAVLENQIASLENAGYFSNDPPAPATLEKFHAADDLSASVEDRARSYLSVNCAQCHQPDGAAQGLWDARPEIDLAASGIVNGLLVNNGGDADNRVLAVGSAAHTMLIQRLDAVDNGSATVNPMPPLGTSVKNQAIIDLLTEWAEPSAEPIDPPTNLSATDDDHTDRVAVVWNAIAGASAYTIFRHTANNSAAATQIGTSATNAFDDTTASPGTGYFYWAKTNVGVQESDFSNSDAGSRDIATPTGLTITQGTFSNRIEVTWNSIASGVNYEVFRNTTSHFGSASLLTTTTNTAYNDMTATPATTYFFWIRARSGAAIGSESATASGFRGVPVPTNVSTNGLSASVQVNWNAVSGASEYRVFRASSNSSAASVQISSTAATTFSDETAQIGSQYFYFLRAAANGTLSDFSAGVSGQRSMQEPGNVVASNDRFTDITVDWDPVPNSTSYLIFRHSIDDSATATFVTSQVGTNYVDTTANAGQTYFYFLRSSSSQGFSGFSAGAQGIRLEPSVRDLEFPVDSPTAPIENPENYAQENSGIYWGLLRADEAAESDVNLNGYASGKISHNQKTQSGSLSLTVYYQLVKYKARGAIAADGTFATVLTKRDESGTPLNLVLQTVATADGKKLTGTLTDNGTAIRIDLFKRSYHRTKNPAPQAGRFTMVMPHDDTSNPSLQPGGDGAAYGSIATNGVGKLSLINGGGSKSTVTIYLSADGELMFYRSLYSKAARGWLGGVLQFREVDNISEADGTLHWFKPANESAVLYADGFDVQQPAMLTSYQRPNSRAGERILSNLRDADLNAAFKIEGGNLAPLDGKFVTWDSRNRISYSSQTVGESLKISVKTASGYVSGRYRDTNTGQDTRFAGVAFQNQGIVVGNFIGDGETGTLAIGSTFFPELETTRAATAEQLTAMDSLDFGDTGFEGGLSEIGIRLDNIGDGKLHFPRSAQVIGDSGFSLVISRSGYVAPGDSTILRIRFEPTDAGTKNATLAIYSNDPSNNPFILNLTGNAVAGFGGSGIENLDPDHIDTPIDLLTHIDAAGDNFDSALHPGRYEGLILNSGSTDSIAGIFRGKLVTSKKTDLGALSGTINLEQQGTRFKGNFDAAGMLQVFPGIYDISLQTISTATGQAQLRGSIQNLETGGQFELIATRFVWNSKTNPAPQSGRYTTLLPLIDDLGVGYPGGDGAGGISVNGSGVARGTVYLADGKRAVWSGRVSGDHQLNVFSFLDKTQPERSFLAGLITFRDIPDISDFDGRLHWTRSPNAKSATFPAGFSIRQPVIGSIYTAPAKGERPLSGFTSETENTDIIFERTGLDDAFEVTWTATNKITGIAGQKLKVSTKSGIITGSRSDNTTMVDFRSAIFQKQNISSGHFYLHDLNTGLIQIFPK